jgi:phosphate transport system substrate-binding protein
LCRFSHLTAKLVRKLAVSGTLVEWPAGRGAKGCKGIAHKVQATKNAIGYVEVAYAEQN